jgi:DNA-binding response OmpR family regulator
VQNVAFMPPELERARPGEALLVVEDDARIASFLLKGLRALGFGVDWVECGQDAIEGVEQAEYAAVVLDLGLPDMDGLEVMARWWENGCRVPVVVLTARSDPRDRERALSLGATAYLTKPAPFGDLVAAIHAAVDPRR